MEIPQGNFFEVTVNSNKLINLIQAFTFQINNVEQKIISFQKLVEDLQASTTAQRKKSDQIRAIEIEKMKRMLFQQSNYSKLFMKETDKKICQKLQTYQQMFTLFDNRINFIKNNLEHDMALKDTFFSDKLVKENQKLIQVIDKKINQNSLKNKFLLDKLQVNILQLDRKYLQLNDKVNSGETSIRDLSRSQIQISLKNSQRQKNRSRRAASGKRNGTIFEDDKKYEQLRQKLLQFEAKLSKTSRKCVQKNKSYSQHKNVRINENHNTYSSNDDKRQTINAIKSTKNIRYTNEQLQQIENNTNIEIKQNQTKKIQFETFIHNKLSLIQNYINKKTQQLQNGILKINNKSDVFKEQISIILRRVQRNKDFAIEIQQSLKNREEKNVDHKLVEKIKNGIAKLSKQMEEIVQTKMTYEFYQKQKTKILEKIANLKQVVGQKAQKFDVKKGLNFLQEKIKEIIIVMAEERNQNRDSATKKIPFKCLSCDKNLDMISNQPPSKNNSNNNSRIERHTTNPMTSIRSTTNLIRKRKRAAHNSIVNDQY